MLPLEQRDLRNWMTGRSSLTARLIAVSKSFAVQLLYEGVAKPHRDEAWLLGLRLGQVARIRQVSLVCDGRPLIYGHTILPLAPRHFFDRVFVGLGQRALGGALFRDPRIRRGPFRFCQLNREHTLALRAARVSGLEGALRSRFWARRSLFTCQGKQILVSEVFLPGLPPPPPLSRFEPLGRV